MAAPTASCTPTTPMANALTAAPSPPTTWVLRVSRSNPESPFQMTICGRSFFVELFSCTARHPQARREAFPDKSSINRRYLLLLFIILLVPGSSSSEAEHLSAQLGDPLRLSKDFRDDYGCSRARRSQSMFCCSKLACVSKMPSCHIFLPERQKVTCVKTFWRPRVSE